MFRCRGKPRSGKDDLGAGSNDVVGVLKPINFFARPEVYERPGWSPQTSSNVALPLGRSCLVDPEMRSFEAV